MITAPKKCTAKLKSGTKTARKKQECIEVQIHGKGNDFQKEQTENTNNPSSNLDKNKLQEGRELHKRM